MTTLDIAKESNIRSVQVVPYANQRNNTTLEPDKNPVSRLDMLKILTEKKRKLENKIEMKEFKFKKAKIHKIFSACTSELEALLKLSPLIRKYEGKSLPLPRKMTVDRKRMLTAEETEFHELLSAKGIENLGEIVTNISPNKLMLHIKERHGNKNCQVCVCDFKTDLENWKHMSSNHTLIECLICGAVSCSVDEFYEHVYERQHGVCTDCDRMTFKSIKEFILHKKIAHPPEKDKNALILKYSDDEPETLKSKLQNHMKLLHPNGICDTCSTNHFKMSLACPDKLYSHFIENHTAIQCAFCSSNRTSEIFCSEKEYFHHCDLMDHKFCPICNDLFKTTFLLNKHLSQDHETINNNDLGN